MDYNLKDLGIEEEKNKSARRRSRELIMQGLYQHLVNNSEYTFILSSLEKSPEFNKSDVSYVNKILQGVIKTKYELDEYIVKFVDREIANLSPIEHSLLLIGTYELLNCIEVPYKVIINEAVELAKRFGGADGYRYVNGVLDKLAPELRPHG